MLLHSRQCRGCTRNYCSTYEHLSCPYKHIFICEFATHNNVRSLWNGKSCFILSFNVKHCYGFWMSWDGSSWFIEMMGCHFIDNINTRWVRNIYSFHKYNGAFNLYCTQNPFHWFINNLFLYQHHVMHHKKLISRKVLSVDEWIWNIHYKQLKSE